MMFVSAMMDKRLEKDMPAVTLELTTLEFRWRWRSDTVYHGMDCSDFLRKTIMSLDLILQTFIYGTQRALRRPCVYIY